MTSRPDSRKGRSLLRLAVAGAVAVGAPVAVAGTANAAPDSSWDKLAQCESGGSWNTNTGNGYSGGLQFSPSTWRAYGGSGSPHNASRAEQIAVAERTLAAQGWNAWPSCSKKAGVRGGAAEPSKERASAPVTEKKNKAAATGNNTAATQSAAPKSAPKAAPKAAPKSSTTPRKSSMATKNGADYTVVKGDTLSKIAERHDVAGGWKTLWERNSDVLSNPNVLRIGQQLDLS